MKTRIFWTLLAVITILYACNTKPAVYAPEGLRKLTADEQVERARNWEIMNYREVTLKTSEGITISYDSLIALWGISPLAVDPYVNDDGEIEVGVIRAQTEADSLLSQKVIAAYREGPEAKLVDINCADIKSILTELGEKDQSSRQGGAPDPKEDFKNLEIARSIIEQCGMPTLDNVDREHINALWLVFQHTTHRYRKEYFHYFQEAVAREELSAGSMALMEDRILMGDNKPQKYGSQIRGSASGEMTLYKLDSPEYVDERRAAVGLGPLSEYVSYWNIKFDIPQKQKSR